MFWVITSAIEAITINSPKDNCSTTASVNLKVAIGNTVTVVPNLVHDMYLLPHKLLSFYPDFVSAHLKIITNMEIKENSKTCSISLKLEKEFAIVRLHEKKIRSRKYRVETTSELNRSRAILSETGPWLKYSFKHNNHVHYILDPGKEKQTWQKVNALCTQQWSTQALSYLSQKELLEISNILEEVPAVVFTSFRSYRKVRQVVHTMYFVCMLIQIKCKG